MSVKAPQRSAQALAHFETRHALSAETSLEIPTGLSIVHCDRHVGSPSQRPRQVSYGSHTALAAQAVDCGQQFVAAHEAQAPSPYWAPQATTFALVPASAGASKYASSPIV